MSKVSTTMSYNMSVFYDTLRLWYSDPVKHNFVDLFNGNVKIGLCDSYISKKTVLSDEPYESQIVTIQQFYVDKNNSRHKENIECLRLNCENPHIHKVILLNERLYSKKELGGIKSSKIQQVIIKKRLTYSDAFRYASKHLENSYVILSNSDIFYDDTIEQVKYSNLHNQKKIFSLLRHEYTGTKPLKQERYHTPRPDCQDVWIWHTNSIQLSNIQYKELDFCLGVPGCDNHFVWVANKYEIECYNEPELIRTYHNHKSDIRNYIINKRRVNPPYMRLFPVLSGKLERHPVMTFDLIDENKQLYDYVREKVRENKSFMLPFFGAEDSEFVRLGILLHTKKSRLNVQNFTMIQNKMKERNINIQNQEDLIQYSREYLDCLQNTERYFWWSSQDRRTTQNIQAYYFLTSNFKKIGHDARCANIYNIWNFERIWLEAIKDMKILFFTDKETYTSENTIISTVFDDKRFEGYDIECKKIQYQSKERNIKEKKLLTYKEYKEHILELVEQTQETQTQKTQIVILQLTGMNNPVADILYKKGFKVVCIE